MGCMLGPAPMKPRNFRFTDRDMERLDRLVTNFNRMGKQAWNWSCHNRSSVLRQLIEDRCLKLDAEELTAKEKMLQPKTRKRKVKK